MLLERISEDIKAAMRSKDQVALRSLRLIKSALMLLHSEGGAKPTEDDEMGVLIKMAKQRRDAIEIFGKEGRQDLLLKEQEELDIIETFLPKALTEEELKTELTSIINELGAEGMKDMGKVMGVASQKLKGKADGKIMSAMVRDLLT